MGWIKPRQTSRGSPAPSQISTSGNWGLIWQVKRPSTICKSTLTIRFTSLTSTISTTGALVHTECPEGKKAYIFSDSYQWPHDVNLTITVMLHLLHTMEVLPPTLYIRLDNCFRENKNQFMLGFCSLLVDIGVFKKVHLLHTYVYKQQCTKSNIWITLWLHTMSCSRAAGQTQFPACGSYTWRHWPNVFMCIGPTEKKWSRNTDR